LIFPLLLTNFILLQGGLLLGFGELIFERVDLSVLRPEDVGEAVEVAADGSEAPVAEIGCDVRAVHVDGNVVYQI
jgi:hypothetical protein